MIAQKHVGDVQMLALVVLVVVLDADQDVLVLVKKLVQDLVIVHVLEIALQVVLVVVRDAAPDVLALVKKLVQDLVIVHVLENALRVLVKIVAIKVVWQLVVILLAKLQDKNNKSRSSLAYFLFILILMG